MIFPNDRNPEWYVGIRGLGRAEQKRFIQGTSSGVGWGTEDKFSIFLLLCGPSLGQTVHITLRFDVVWNIMEAESRLDKNIVSWG